MAKLFSLLILVSFAISVYGNDPYQGGGTHHVEPPKPSVPKIPMVHPPKAAPAPHKHAHPVHPPKVAPAPHKPVHPIHPPKAAPAPHKPAQPPTKAHTKTLVEVQGYIACKACIHAGVNNLANATAIKGAYVKLVCLCSKPTTVVKAVTDKNGYFHIKAPKTITSDVVGKCKVSLVSSPNKKCNKASNLHFGIVGSPLKAEKQFKDHSGNLVTLYTVGPFAYEPKCPK
ncbi:hypothetical protein ACFE04_000991 [Oxalis oulophora]